MKTVTCGLMVLSLVTCALATVPASAAAQKDKNPDVISRSELLQSAQKSKDLYDAVRSLRPKFIAPLSTRTQGGQAYRRLPPAVVYVDGAFSGELDVMHGISVQNVEEVRFKGPTEAVIDLGPNAPGGAIMVTLHKEPRP